MGASRDRHRQCQRRVIQVRPENQGSALFCETLQHRKVGDEGPEPLQKSSGKPRSRNRRAAKTMKASDQLERETREVIRAGWLRAGRVLVEVIRDADGQPAILKMLSRPAMSKQELLDALDAKGRLNRQPVKRNRA